MPEPGEAIRPLQPAAPSLLRSSAVVAVGTALSRLTGFGRLAATAYAIGFTRLTDTYTLANTTPNIVYELLLGGVLSATLVPVFVDQADRGDDDGTSAVVSVASVLLVMGTVLGLVAAPWIVSVYTIGVPGDVAGDQQEVATSLLRFFVPQILFFGFTAMATALLHARRRFAAPSFAPAINNTLVAAMLLALPRLADGAPSLEDVATDGVLLLSLGLGTTAGVAAMSLALWPALRHAGVHLRLNLDWRHPAVRQVARLSGWTAGYVLCNQAALLVILVLANRHAGGVSTYTGAFVFFQLPHALFAVSLMTTFVPELAATANRLDFAAFRDRFGRGLRLVSLVMLPAATGYVVLAHPIVVALLERGAFSPASADLTADVLAAFALGLFGFSVYLFALRGFYSLRDTRTPFMLSAGQNTVNVVLALALEPHLGVPGLALAYGGAYTLAAAAALVMLRRRVGSFDERGMVASILRVAGACAAMALVLIPLVALIDNAFVTTAVGVPFGAGVFLVVLAALGSEEIAMLRQRLAGAGLLTGGR